MVEEEIVTILKEIYQQVREINDYDRDPEDVMYHIMVPLSGQPYKKH